MCERFIASLAETICIQIKSCVLIFYIIRNYFVFSTTFYWFQIPLKQLLLFFKELLTKLYNLRFELCNLCIYFVLNILICIFFLFGNNLHSHYFGLTQLQCFSLGAEVGPHKKDHKYRIMVSAIFTL